jgi:hypothetical protein
MRALNDAVAPTVRKQSFADIFVRELWFLFELEKSRFRLEGRRTICFLVIYTGSYRLLSLRLRQGGEAPRRRVVVDASKLSFRASESLSKKMRIGCVHHMHKSCSYQMQGGTRGFKW